MQSIVHRLQAERHRSSTKMTYYRVWVKFNEFFLRLDWKPPTWEERLTLFIGFMVDNNRKSVTVKSYISAIKAVLDISRHPINEDQSTLNALTRACRLRNDKLTMKFPIKKGLLTLLIKELSIIFESQPYLETLYKSMFAAAYYGLFRIGEITLSDHVIKATDVHVGLNKKSLMFILHSSKTHTPGQKPQIIKISAQTTKHRIPNSSLKYSGADQKEQNKICPFQLLQNYLKVRKNRKTTNEPFFIFRDRSPVQPFHF